MDIIIKDVIDDNTLDTLNTNLTDGFNNEFNNLTDPENPGLGFKGFSLEGFRTRGFPGATTYVKQANFYKKPENFKFFDIIPEITGLPGTSVKDLGFETSFPPDNMSYYKYDNSTLFYHNIRWYLQNNGDYISNIDFFQKAKMPKINPMVNRPRVEVKFVNALEQTFLMYYRLEAEIKLQISCNKDIVEVEIPAFIRPNKQPTDTIYFVKKPNVLTVNDRIVVRAKSILKNQKVGDTNRYPLLQHRHQFPQLPLDSNKQQFRLYAINDDHKNKFNEIIGIIKGARNDPDFYDKWDFEYSPITDVVTGDDKPIDILKSEKINDTKIKIFASEEIPSFWNRIKIKGHDVSRVNAVWDTEAVVGNTPDTLILNMGKYNGPNGTKSGQITRYIEQSNLIPDFEQPWVFRDAFIRTLNNCLMAKINYLKQDIKNLKAALAKHPEALEIIDKKSCATKITVVGLRLLSYMPFFGDEDNLILNFGYQFNRKLDNTGKAILDNGGNTIQETDLSKQFFMINIAPNGDQFKLETYTECFK
jgi:hypothetical protein